jgi:hypothetical protein
MKRFLVIFLGAVAAIVGAQAVWQSQTQARVPKVAHGVRAEPDHLPPTANSEVFEVSEKDLVMMGMVEGARDPDPDRGTCTCSIIYDSDCHYESVPGYACSIYTHYDNGTHWTQWVSDPSGTNWGIRRNGSLYSLAVLCPIPTDYGLSSIKNYGDVAYVTAYIYNAIESTVSTDIYSGAGPSSTYHGSASTSMTGQVALSVSPGGTKYANFWAKVTLNTTDSTAFHSLRICYDPD